MSRDVILEKADQYAHIVYDLFLRFPREEQYGLTSQLRRAGLSVPLNIVEGFARQSLNTQRQLLLVAYGSLKEAQYLVRFALRRGFISESQANPLLERGEELGRLLWAKARTLSKQRYS
jgi:four helix bundle protein